METTINFWAVLVAAVVNIAVGSIWYGPLFGKMWKRLMGFTDESLKSMKLSATQAMVGGLVTAFLMAYVLAYFANMLNLSGAGGAWQLTFWVWLGFLATTSATSFLWEGKPFKLFVLNAAQHLVSVFLMALVLVMWQ